MQDMQIAITLLSIIVGLLSVVIIALLSILIALLLKIRQLARRVDVITTNVARASEWLSPTKVFSEISQLFRK